ncbi:hypothetical protein [Microbacterium sp.]|uniref:hypothetical protein n=1 Tax=Microbacterium sp. TaxID=51671 RepID=UPI002810F921|nr:hypothetical protein [Microbacterium sp.]
MSAGVNADEFLDPFWSVVRRRHPDLDIVILPPARPRPAESSQPRRAPGPFARMQMEDMDELWATVVDRGLPRRNVQWIPGPTHDSVRHTVTLTLDEVGRVAGISHLREAVTVLKNDGWEVFTPPTGMPRLVADRPGELGDESLLFGYAPEQRRLFARLTSTGLPVDDRQARALIGGAA